MSYCVYRHTCPNGKVYIGITCKKPQYRWAEGYGYKNNEHFFRAIIKYGWDNIAHEILFDSLTKKEAEAKEIELIAEYKSTSEKYGYNISSGGENHFAGYHHSEVTKRKIGEAQRGLLNHMYGKEPWNKGKRINVETRNKMSNNRPKKAIMQYDKNGDLVAEYESLTVAARAIGVTKQSISKVCGKNDKYCAGCFWRYVE